MNGLSLLTYSYLEKYVMALMGRADIKDALGRLDRLTQEEARMATAQGLKATHEVDDKVQAVDDRVREVGELVIDGVQFGFNQLPTRHSRLHLARR